MCYIDGFENKIRDKLYANVKRILNPSISKKNISNYKIILNDEIYPIRVFYPQKLSSIKDIIIYIHGISKVSGLMGNYNDICNDLALKSNKLVLAVDYDENKYYIDNLNKCISTVNYIIDEFINNNFEKENISLMGDSIGGTLALSISQSLNKKIQKLILINPILRGNYSKADNINNELYKNLNDYYKNNLKYKKDYKNNLIFPLCSKKNQTRDNILIISSTNNPLIEEAKLYKDISNCDLIEIPVINNTYIYDFAKDFNNIFYNTIRNYLENNKINC